MKVVCAHCALPFSVARPTSGRPVFCCSGCALAARVPVGASGQFPINRALLAALSVGFAYFNQTLFWLLAILLTRDSTAPNAPANAERFMWASLALGTVVWAALGLSQIFAGARRPADHCVLFAAALLTGYSVKTAQPSLALGANALLAAWALRGLGRKKPIA